MRLTSTTLATLSLALASPLLLAQNPKIERQPVPNFPISTAVTIPAGATTYYLSGVVPPKLADGSYGANTEQQTVNILRAIETHLKNLGLGLEDVVKMQVFLVADPKLGNKMDFTGFMKGYSQFFGTQAQPNTPARSAFEIKGLVMPQWLIEIEVVAAKVPTR
ncbi:MAG: RidA family protein [Neisseriaceae bacterium]|nr:RidA family protein [Neisseriaceae bacterium]MBP6863287.1 RidA family protein [Neisseriaceae bacterium]